MTLSTLMLLSAIQSAAAQDSSDDAVAERLLGQPAAAQQSAVGGSGSPWWIWPLGLLGVAGAAGMAYQNRRSSDGISSDVIVLSRTAVSRTSSLAVIEVSDASGQTRRMLVGIGGGAPSMVADLSPSGDTSASAAALEEAWMTAGESAVTATVTDAPVTDTAAPKADEDEIDLVSPRRRGAAAYAAAEEAPPRRRRQPAVAEKTELISAVLAEKTDTRREAPAAPPRRRRKAREEETWQDPWARNFAAILGQPSAQRSK